MLQKTPQKFMRGQGHRLASLTTTVAEGEGDAVVIAGGDGLVAEGGAVHVATEVVEDVMRLRDGFGEDDPALGPGDVGQSGGRQRAAGKMQKATAEVLAEGSQGYEKLFAVHRWREPCVPVGCEGASWDEQVQMGVPFERARPGVQRRQGADTTSEPPRIGTQCLEGLERGSKQNSDELALVRAHEATKLGG